MAMAMDTAMDELRHPPSPGHLADMYTSQNGTVGGADEMTPKVPTRSREARQAVDVSLTAAYPYGRCVSLEEAPPYLRRNFILTGYYIGGTHLASAQRTLFAWNNETLNAWTIIAGVFVGLAGISHVRQNLPGYWAPFTLMALSGLPHAPWSIALHCTIGVDEATRDFLRTMDVFHIVSCGVARGLALAWFVFRSRPVWWIYAAVMGADWAFCVLSMFVLRRVKDLPKATLARDVAVIVLCYITPAVVGAIRETVHEGPGTCTALVLGMLACLYVSLWFYARHLPERWFPGRFDIIGNSHQIMHVLVVLEYSLEWLFVIHLATRDWLSRRDGLGWWAAGGGAQLAG